MNCVRSQSYSAIGPCAGRPSEGESSTCGAISHTSRSGSLRGVGLSPGGRPSRVWPTIISTALIGSHGRSCAVRARPIVLKSGPYLVHGYLHTRPGFRPAPALRQPEGDGAADRSLAGGRLHRPASRPRIGTIVVNRELVDRADHSPDEDIRVDLPVETTTDPRATDMTGHVRLPATPRGAGMAAPESSRRLRVITGSLSAGPRSVGPRASADTRADAWCVGAPMHVVRGPTRAYASLRGLPSRGGSDPGRCPAQRLLPPDGPVGAG